MKLDLCWLIGFAAAGSMHGSILANAQIGQSYSIRADPGVAGKINAVLARYAEPVATKVPTNQDDVEGFLANRCARKSVPKIYSIRESTDPQSLVVTHAPCLLSRAPREFKVEKGTTLIEIARFSGLNEGRVKEFNVVSGPNNPPRKTIANTKLLPGDIVTIPESVSRTRFNIMFSGVTSQRLIMNAIGDALNCPKGDVESCLISHRVMLLQGSSIEDTSTVESPHMPENVFDRADNPSPGAAEIPIPEFPKHVSHHIGQHPQIAIPSAGFMTLPKEVKISVGPNVINRNPFAPKAGIHSLRKRDAPFILSTGIVNLDRKPASQLVHAKQWPYDIGYIAKILSHSDTALTPIVIGVADVGLGGEQGYPIRKDLFHLNNNDTSENAHDDDGNRYVNDYVGGGGLRTKDQFSYPEFNGTGRVNLCDAEMENSVWDGEAFENASHGTVVASIAGGNAIRSNVLKSTAYPKLRFFRLFNEAVCDPAKNFDPTPLSIESAIHYFFDNPTPSNVVNLSYDFNLPTNATGEQTLRVLIDSYLGRRDRFLVVAAGNHSQNLDDKPILPASYADPTLFLDEKNMKDRVLAVGAATANLRIIAGKRGSNFGRAVKIFAPGRPHGAIDIRGADASYFKGSTSYAAAYVSSAVGLLKALNISDLYQIQQRLAVASWPRFDGDGSWRPGNRGIVDLTKISAIKYDVVETMEAVEGKTVRRNWIGNIRNAQNEIGICGGETLNRSQHLSARFWTGDYAQRNVSIVKQTDTGFDVWKKDQRHCPLTGSTITIDDLLTGQKIDIPLDEVTQIIFKQR